MKIKNFLSTDQKSISEAYEIRKKVFVQEQKVDQREEFDDFDASSLHYLVHIDGKSIGTARWRFTEKGIKFERFAVLKEYRQNGVGKMLLNTMLNDIPKDLNLFLHAQVSVIPFYEKSGFVKEGEMFSECEIDHYKMIYKDSSLELKLKEVIDYVKEFHQSFRIPFENKPKAEIDSSLVDLRHRLMQEENEEYLEAAKAGDLVEIADALGDMLYILSGTIISHGLQHKIEEVYREIQRSNMSKLDANGNPIYREDGKVLKSDLYFKPDIATILKI